MIHDSTPPVPVLTKLLLLPLLIVVFLLVVFVAVVVNVSVSLAGERGAAEALLLLGRKNKYGTVTAEDFDVVVVVLARCLDDCFASATLMDGAHASLLLLLVVVVVLVAMVAIFFTRFVVGAMLSRLVKLFVGSRI